MVRCGSSAAGRGQTVAAGDVDVEARLQRWAQAVTVGDGSGYPSMSVIHPNWSPPTKGSRPVMKTMPGGADVQATHRAIGRLSIKQRDAICLHYAYRLSSALHAERTGCAERTVRDRLDAARRALAAMWSDRSFCNSPQVA